jgi:hypothetical protein
MHEALIEVARVIAAAHHRWRSRLGRRPLSGEVSRLEERVRRIEIENDLLRRRIRRVPARRRPYYRPWERLDWPARYAGSACGPGVGTAASTRSTLSLNHGE